MLDGPHFRVDRVKGAPDAATIAAFDAPMLALPLSGQVRAREGAIQAGPSECLMAGALNQIDFAEAEVTLLVRAA
jgi:mannose-6-phosphate isomerase